MNTWGAGPVHLLRHPPDASSVWCSGDGIDRSTGCVSEATCARCLEAAVEHYGARHEESGKQVQNLMDRQAEVWCADGLDAGSWGDSDW